MLTVAQFKTKITPKLHGTTLARVTDFYGKLGEAAGNILARIDPYTTIRRARIENAIYDKVYNYTAATDLKGISKVVDIRPIGERDPRDTNVGAYSRQFDTKKYTDSFTIEVINGVKTLRLSKNLTARTTLFTCDSLTLEGVPVASGDAQNLVIDTLDAISGSGSIKFGLSGSTGQGKITIPLNNTIDLSDMEDVGALFYWLKMNNVSRITNLKLRWGSDSSNYWEQTVTAAHDRPFETDAFLLNRFDWDDATETGTPDSSAVDWLEVEINYSAGTALTNFKLDNFTASKGKAYEVLYYSDCLFRDTTGVTYKAAPTADSDVILLDDTQVNLMIYEALPLFGQEIKGKNMASDYKFCENKLNGYGDVPGLYDLYEENYPSQAIEHQEEYYRFKEIGGDDDCDSDYDD